MPAALTWAHEEDEQLRELVAVHGTKAWAKIAALIRTKGSKQCRRRWKNFLNMSAKTCSWSPEEDAMLIDAHRRLGNRWTEISKIFGDRTDNAVKNRWHALLRKHPNLDRGGSNGDDSFGAAPRSSKRRRMRLVAVHDDSDHRDSGRYGHSMQYTSSGGISAAAMPTPFDQRQLGGSGGSNGVSAAVAAAVAAAAANQRAALAQQQSVAQFAVLQHQQQMQQQAWAGRQQFYGQNPAPPLQIMVAKDFLSPWEQQLAGQINAMNLPVHVEVASAPIPIPPVPHVDPSSLLLAPEMVAVPDGIANRNSWRQYVEKFDEPGDSKGLQELLDWFSSTGTSGLSMCPATQHDSKDVGLSLGFGSRRLTRSLSKGGSGSGNGTTSGNLSGDHRQLLVKLMSRGLEMRSSSEQDMAAMVGGSTNSLNPSPHDPSSAATGPRFDPFCRTRSTSSKSTQERERAAAAATAAVQQAGLAAAAAATAATAAGNGGFRAPDPSAQSGVQGRILCIGSQPSSLSIPLIEPTPFNPSISDVLVTPSFSSEEIAMLIDTLKPKR